LLLQFPAPICTFTQRFRLQKAEKSSLSLAKSWHLKVGIVLKKQFDPLAVAEMTFLSTLV